MIDVAPHPSQRRYACPDCGALLQHPADDVAICPVDKISFRKTRGIWQLVSPARVEYFERFVDDYDHVRRMERRGGSRAAYFRKLPYEDVTGRYKADWRVRAESYLCFVRNVLEKLETAGCTMLDGNREDRPYAHRRLRILDLGAGNCWMSNRLAQRGHAVAAVDLRTGTEDGLGAHAHYAGDFDVVRAEFDRLPFQDGSFDVVIFNASFHYSEQYERTLNEAHRVLRRDGRIIIVDTPLYSDAGSGDTMVRERTSRFERTYGLASDALRSENFLTERRLRQLAVRAGITWTLHAPDYGAGWMMRRFVSRIRNRREPARFAVIEGERSIDSGAAIAHMKPTRSWQAIGRAGLRLRYLALQRHKLRRATEESVLGLQFRIPVGIFHPVVFRSGVLLAGLILDDVLPDAARVLDVGCGTGISALAAASRGADVTAVDINPAAVSTTLQNAAANGLKIRAVESDLFENVGLFDVILFNPPYYAGRPGTPFDLAWRSDDVVERFSRGLRAHLSAKGFALVVLSSDGRGGEYLRQFEADGHRISRVVERRYLNETLSVFRLR